MPRLSVPVSIEKLKEYNRVVPWGMRHDIIRRLVQMFLDAGHPLELAYEDNFKIVRKEASDCGDRGHSQECERDDYGAD